MESKQKKKKQLRLEDINTKVTNLREELSNTLNAANPVRISGHAKEQNKC